MGKGFDLSAPCGALAPVAHIGHPTKGSIELQVNGAIRQSADLDDLIWSVPEIVAELSRFVELRPGDLIMTGTPAGVGPVQAGERIVGKNAGVGSVVGSYAASAP
jgi:fumarylpyruvate hydrolase